MDAGYHHTRHLTRLLAMIALLAFMLRSLVPDGYMPTFLGDGSFAATICTGTTAEPGRTADTPAQSDDIKHKKTCPFVGLTSPMATAEFPLVATALQAPSPVRWQFTAWFGDHRYRAHERPWATGPPTPQVAA